MPCNPVLLQPHPCLIVLFSQLVKARGPTYRCLNIYLSLWWVEIRHVSACAGAGEFLLIHILLSRLMCLSHCVKGTRYIRRCWYMFGCEQETAIKNKLAWHLQHSHQLQLLLLLLLFSTTTSISIISNSSSSPSPSQVFRKFLCRAVPQFQLRDDEITNICSILWMIKYFKIGDWDETSKIEWKKKSKLKVFIRWVTKLVSIF